MLLLLFSVLTAAEDPWGKYFSQISGWTWATAAFFFAFICLLAACSFRLAQLHRLDAEMITGTQWSDEMFRKMHKTHMHEEEETEEMSEFGALIGAMAKTIMNQQHGTTVKFNEKDFQSELEISETKPKLHDKRVSFVEDEKRFEALDKHQMKTMGESELMLKEVATGTPILQKQNPPGDQVGWLSLGNIRTDTESQSNLGKVRSALWEEQARQKSPTINEESENYHTEDDGAEDDGTEGKNISKGQEEPPIQKVRTSFLNLDEKTTEMPSLGEVSKEIAQLTVDEDPRLRLRAVSTEK